MGFPAASVAAQVQAVRVRAELGDVKARIDRLNGAFTECSIDISEFKELKNPLIPRKVDLEEKLPALEKAKSKRLEPLRNWIFEANSLENTVFQDNLREMASFLRKVGSNRVLRDQTVTVSFITPWNSLAETIAAARADNESSLSE